MNRLLLILAALALVLTGCTHTRTVNLNEHAEPAFAKVNRLGSRQTATVTLIDQLHSTVDTRRVRGLQMTPDSTSWFNGSSGQFESVATAAIAEVRFVRHDKGARDGLIRGAVVGTALGIVVGLNDEPTCGFSGDTPCSTSVINAHKKNVPGFAGAGALVGSLVGFVYGTAAASVDVYRFEAPAPAPPVVTTNAKQQIPRRE